MNPIYEVKAPSNIALIKYWGKSDSTQQWPANSSVSMTLKHAYTQTKVSKIDLATDQIIYNGEDLAKDCDFVKKINVHLALLRKWTNQTPTSLRVETFNSFPSDCGIASSASGMAALTISATAALTDAKSFAELHSKGFSKEALAHYARLGSGSACRSLYGGFVTWQRGPSPQSQSVRQLFSENHWHLCNAIVLVSSTQKKVSSRDAHAYAWSSPLFKPRLSYLSERMSHLTSALEHRDFELLGTLAEQDALEMHSIIMTANPALNYLTSQTIELICWLREERAKGNLFAYFTIDAGPNMHILCEPANKNKVAELIASRFPNTPIIWDEIGSGPELIVHNKEES